MKRHTRSILEELTSMSNEIDNTHLIENKASNVVAAVRNLTYLIRETYDEDTSNDLIKRLYNSINSQDMVKFKRGIRKIHENKRHTRD